MVPLAVIAVGLLAFFFAPISQPRDMLDFWAHYNTRTEVVRRLEASELGTLGGPHSPLVPLPEYQRSVSYPGYQVIEAERQNNTLQVVFFPVPTLRNDLSVFVYRSDGQPPATLRKYGREAAAFELLADHWYRVVFE
jgi:hypothetical protein